MYNLNERAVQFCPGMCKILTTECAKSLLLSTLFLAAVGAGTTVHCICQIHEVHSQLQQRPENLINKVFH